MIIYSLSILLFVAAFMIPFFLAGQIPPMRLLFLFIVPTVLVALSLITVSFMKSVPVGGWSFYGWFPNEPTQWVDFKLYYREYRTIILVEAAVNALFFICLIGFFLLSGQAANLELSSEMTGFLISSHGSSRTG